MTTNTKTPAMLIQEFTVRKKLAPPEYNLIVCNQGTHENEFQYRVSVANIDAIGIGRSKQVAKHDAAFKAIALLTEMGIYDAADAPLKDFNPQMHRNEPANPSESVTNCIGSLQDACCEHKIPPPIFTEISFVGPPHCRQFTWECQCGSIKTQATANTKKQAKQIAAKLMLERMKNVFPELSAEMEDLRNAITDVDVEAKNKYAELSFFNVIPNKKVKIADFSNCFISLMEERELTFDDFKEFFKEKNEDSLEKILAKMELKFQIVPIQDEPSTVILNVSTDTPFCTLGMANSMEAAKNEALSYAFEIMETYMTTKTIDSL